MACFRGKENLEGRIERHKLEMAFNSEDRKTLLAMGKSISLTT